MSIGNSNGLFHRLRAPLPPSRGLPRLRSVRPPCAAPPGERPALERPRRAAHRAIAHVAEAIPEHDRSPEAGELCTTVPELFALVGDNDVVSWRPSSAPRSPSQ